MEFLKERVLSLLELAEQDRAKASMKFSLPHFHALSEKALDSLSQSSSSKVACFSQVSRSRGFSTSLFPHCLEDLLDQTPAGAWLWHVTAPLIASALLLSSYPPGAHSEFALSSI
jgi:hypothetical protein